MKGLNLEKSKKSEKELNLQLIIFSNNKGQDDPTSNFGWDYILVDNDKIAIAWCMPLGKIAVYTGFLKNNKNTDALSIVMGHEIVFSCSSEAI